MNYHRFPLTSADASSDPQLSDQYIHATPDWWEKYNPGDGAIARGSQRRRASVDPWRDEGLR